MCRQISGGIGVSCYRPLPDQMLRAAVLAVATAIAVAQAAKTLHPQDGATALIAVTGREKIHAPGYLYVLGPSPRVL